MLVVSTKDTKFNTGHEHGRFDYAGKGGEVAEFEFPLVVFNPAVFLLRLFLEVGAAAVGGQVLVVAAVPQ